MDNVSDFEVDPRGGNSHGGNNDWISETMSEDTPLFGDKPPSPGLRDHEVVVDRWRKVWLVFYILGMTTLLPWNFFIAVNDYWNYKFRNVTDVTNSSNSNQTVLQKEFTSYLAISSNIPNAIFVILNVVYGQRFRLNVRLVGSLSVMATLFIAVLIMTRMDTDTWQQSFLLSTLFIVVILNICTAIFQVYNTTINLASWNPSKGQFDWCGRQVPIQLHGRHDGGPGSGRNISCSGQHCSHCSSGRV